MSQYQDEYKKCVYYLHFVRNRLQAAGKLDTIYGTNSSLYGYSAKECIDSLIELIEEIET